MSDIHALRLATQSSQTTGQADGRNELEQATEVPAARGRAAEVRAAEAERLAQLRDGSISDATWSAYLGAWTRWATWAGTHHRPVLPADAHDLGVWAYEAVYPPHQNRTGHEDSGGRPIDPENLDVAVLGHDEEPAASDSSAASGWTTSIRRADRTGGIGASTLTKWMAAVAFIHRRAGHPSPLEDPTLTSVLKGLRRDMVTTKPAPRPAPALLTDDVEQIAAALDSSDTRGESLREVRDRALVLLAFTSAMRASELAALDVEDFEPDEGGLIVRIRSSKTDQEGAGAFIAIPWARRPHLCPVRATDHWLARLTRQVAAQDATHLVPAAAQIDPRALARGPRAGVARSREHLPARRALVASLPGAVFRALRRNDNLGSPRARTPHEARMARLAITEVITERARAAGLRAPDSSGRYYSAHSTRAGFATQASMNGVAERTLMDHGRWKSLAVARSYIRRGELFEDDNAAGHLGL